jgi:hypothetical protein
MPWWVIGLAVVAALYVASAVVIRRIDSEINPPYDAK